jgi:hypothetical protein
MVCSQPEWQKVTAVPVKEVFWPGHTGCGRTTEPAVAFDRNFRERANDSFNGAHSSRNENLWLLTLKFLC